VICKKETEGCITATGHKLYILCPECKNKEDDALNKQIEQMAICADKVLLSLFKQGVEVKEKLS
jgi:hypothetical protein